MSTIISPQDSPHQSTDDTKHQQHEQQDNIDSPKSSSSAPIGSIDSGVDSILALPEEKKAASSPPSSPTMPRSPPVSSSPSVIARESVEILSLSPSSSSSSSASASLDTSQPQQEENPQQQPEGETSSLTPKKCLSRVLKSTPESVELRKKLFTPYLYCAENSASAGRPPASAHFQGQMLVIKDQLYWNVLNPNEKRKYWVSVKHENVQRTLALVRKRLASSINQQSESMKKIILANKVDDEIHAWMFRNIGLALPLGSHLIRERNGKKLDIYLTIELRTGSRQWVRFSPKEVKPLKKIFLRDTGLAKIPPAIKPLFNLVVNVD